MTSTRVKNTYTEPHSTTSVLLAQYHLQYTGVITTPHQPTMSQLQQLLTQLNLPVEQQEQVKQFVIDRIAQYKAKRTSNKLVYGYILPVITLYISYKLYQNLFPVPAIKPDNKSVLVTGCDTGFGHGVAVALDKLGYIVYAGVYSESTTGAQQLKQKLSARSHVFKLDVTSQSDIDSALKLISSNTTTLHGLVNNAGIGAGGLIDWMSISDLRKVMEVNYFGQVMVTKAFLPLLTARRDSRIVNLCSVAGYLASAGMCAYNSSKYAMEAFSDTLRREMMMWQVKVSIIEPGFMKTPIVEGHEDAMTKLWNAQPQQVKQRYGHEFGINLMNTTAQQTKKLIDAAEDPILVVNDIVHALSSTRPHIRYRPGWQSSKFLFPLSTLPAWITDWVLTRGQTNAPKPAGLVKQLQQ